MAQETATSESDEQDTERRWLSTLDVGAVVSATGEGRKCVLMDCARPNKHGSWVWALKYADTGEYAGLLTDGAALGSSSGEKVVFHGYE